MRRLEQTTQIMGPAGVLELVVLPVSQGVSPRGMAIVCAPNPQAGGTMQNKVVTTTAQALHLQGYTVIRFNYRGVGGSAGVYGMISGEVEDLRAVLRWARAQPWAHPNILLAGFSFGAFIAASVTHECVEIGCLLTIAPAADRHDFSSLTGVKCPWIVIATEEDEIVPYSSVLSWLQNFALSPHHIKLRGASHFFHGRLIELRTVIQRSLEDIL